MYVLQKLLLQLSDRMWLWLGPQELTILLYFQVWFIF